jgi:3-oxoacyl-[acyl-carrier protein] reductase
VVVGATGYIGSAVVERLASAGTAILGIYRANQARAAELAASHPEFSSMQLDISDPANLAGLVTEVRTRSAMDLALVWCAGAKLRRHAIATSREEIEHLMQVNATSPIDLARAFLRLMLPFRRGRIVLVGSRAGILGAPSQAAYAASKSALSGWVSSVASELPTSFITVNVVAPGALDDGEEMYSAEDRRAVCDRIGLRRLGTAREVAGVVAFLLSDEASYVHGATIPIDGGARF